MKHLKSLVVLLALLATLLGGYLLGVSAPHGQPALLVLHQSAAHQFLAGLSGGGGSGGSGGSGGGGGL
jgi:hypothetical protein